MSKKQPRGWVVRIRKTGTLLAYTFRQTRAAALAAFRAEFHCTYEMWDAHYEKKYEAVRATLSETHL